MGAYRELTYQATVTKKLDGQLADLVHFVRYVQMQKLQDVSDDAEGDAKLVECAGWFWDMQHGE